MVAVLITGMSGAGKSTALEALARRGHETVDTDDAGWIEVVDGEPLWIEPRIEALLGRPRNGPLFVQGTVANLGRFADRFDAVVLLTAPIEVLLERIAARTSNAFGKAPAERAAVVRDTAEVEPRLRRRATHVLDATLPPERIVAELLKIASPA